MTEEKIKKLFDDYKRFKSFWKVNESLESQGVYGFIKTEVKAKYIKFFKSFEQKFTNKK
tara:strand:- start:113 stop:289 length:177 start_codon:yes stop_codon:yes gene_type:complete